MSPRSLPDLIRESPALLRVDDTVGTAVRVLADSALPALPLVDDEGRYAGLFGEREFIAALFPLYLDELRSARFVPRSMDEAMARRSGCAQEPVVSYANTEPVDVPPQASDLQLAETFLHHRVSVVPVTVDERVVGVIARRDFFHALAAGLGRTMEGGDP